MAGTMAEIIALRGFPYSKNGITIESAAIGDSVTLDAQVAKGLVDEGFAELVDPSLAAAPADGQEQQSAATVPTAGETPATGNGRASEKSPVIDIPNDWRVMHHLKQINLAKQFDQAVATKAEAVAAIEAYLAAKAE